MNDKRRDRGRPQDFGRASFNAQFAHKKEEPPEDPMSPASIDRYIRDFKFIEEAE